MDTITKVLTTDDLAWVSSRLIAEWNYAKNKPPGERGIAISILVLRALRFGLEDLVSKFGYLIIDIPLENNRSARLIIPNDITEKDIGIILHRLEMLTIDMDDETSVATGDAQSGEAGKQISNPTDGNKIK